MLIATKFCSTRIIHFKYGKWTKVEEAGCSISQCTDLTVQRAQSSNVRVAILGRNGNGGTHTHTCTEMQLWNTRYTYYMAIGIKKLYLLIQLSSNTFACWMYSFNWSPNGTSADRILVDLFNQMNEQHGKPAKKSPNSRSLRVNSTAVSHPVLMFLYACAC